MTFLQAIQDTILEKPPSSMFSCVKNQTQHLVIASDPVSNFPRKAAEHLVNNPLIAIDPHLNATSQMADIVFPSAFVGIETSGTAYRMDHVPLPLKKVVEPPKGVLPDEEILRRMLLEVRKVKKRRKLEQR